MPSVCPHLTTVYNLNLADDSHQCFRQLWLNRWKNYSCSASLQCNGSGAIRPDFWTLSPLLVFSRAFSLLSTVHCIQKVMCTCSWTSSFWPDHTEAKIILFSCTFLLLSTWLCSWFTHGKDTKDKITRFTLWTNGPGSNLYWTLSWSENQTFLVFSLIVSPFYLCHYVKKVLRLFQ